ncbi:cytochrome b [Elioraea sp.]|uniref:cytochrome b n=1 Tax=Elioraea sp. TaxID=2185103 RepID=UPI003F6F84AB
MPLWNCRDGYGSVTKTLHWVVVALFAAQYASALTMTRMGDGVRAAGLSRDDLYNWHKTLGLVALAVAIGRLAARHVGELPEWAPSLSPAERHFVHRAEQVLYAAMLIMPVSGFVYVMAGDYGVAFAGVVELANPIGRSETLAAVARVVHIGAAIVLAAALAGHVGLVLRHTLVRRDGLVWRMLPARR